jgi:hypothetical protein
MDPLKNPVTMKVDGFKDREVMLVNYHFDQAVDIEGQISGIPRGGRITIRVKAMNDGNSELLSWMIAPHLAKSGSLEFLKTTDGSTMKTIEFADAYCIDFVENWEDKEGHWEEIRLSCRKITLGPVTYELPWA